MDRAGSPNQAPAKFTAIGWPLATPRYNYFKRFLDLNRSLVGIENIIFPRRLIDAIHEIPIVGFDEVSAIKDLDTRRYLVMTINDQIINETKGLLGAEACVQHPSEVLQGIFENASERAMLTSPFPQLTVDDLHVLSRDVETNIADRICGLDGLENYGVIRRAFIEFRWDRLFDVKVLKSVDEWTATCIEHCIRRGIRDFIFEGIGSSHIDVFLQTVALLEIKNWSVYSHATEFDNGRQFYEDVLGARMKSVNAIPPVRVCMLSASVPRVIRVLDSLGPRAAEAFGIVHLSRSLIDLGALVEALNERQLRHRVVLETCSVDPSSLYGMIVPIFD